MCRKTLIDKIRQTAPAWEKVCLLLFFIICLVLAAATCVEQARGTAEAHRLVYGTWWFVLLWALAAAVSLAAPQHFAAGTGRRRRDTPPG